MGWSKTLIVFTKLSIGTTEVAPILPTFDKAKTQ